MFNCGEIEIIPFGKERFACAQGWVMNPQIALQDLLAAIDCLQSCEHFGTATIIAPEIRPRLFTLKDHRVAEGTVSLWTISCDIRAIARVWERDFKSREAITVFLRPN